MPDSAAVADDPTAAWLHRGGSPGSWRNLGLWPAPDYAAACTALARRVGAAAGLGRGQRALSLASGAGDELALWRGEFGVAEAIGTERGTGAPPPGPFEAVVCVDAAYHFSPRAAFLSDAFGRLAPSGRLAFTDLTLAGRSGWVIRGAARVCGLAAAEIVPLAQRSRQLRAAGFVDVVAEPLDEAVLEGFAAFVAAQRSRVGSGPGARRAVVTAALIPPCRRAGLGYALFSARRP
jgi:SAM-dependent methyltransferase